MRFWFPVASIFSAVTEQQEDNGEQWDSTLGNVKTSFRSRTLKNVINKNNSVILDYRKKKKRQLAGIEPSRATVCEDTKPLLKHLKSILT